MAVSRSVSLPKELNSMAKRLASILTKTAKSLAPNAHIRRSIKTKTVKDGDSVSLVVSANSPDARAYEKGSGIHSLGKRKSKFQQGVKGKIRIQPKPTNVTGLLYFPFSKITDATPRGPKYRGRTQKGIPKFRYVEHPGVQAANGGIGYLKPSYQRMRNQLKKELRLALKKSLIADIKAVMQTGTK